MAGYCLSFLWADNEGCTKLTPWSRGAFLPLCVNLECTIPYCDTRVILQRWFSKRKRNKTKRKESSACGPQVCGDWKWMERWEGRASGASSPLEGVGGPWTLVGKSRSTQTREERRGSHQQTLSVFQFCQEWDLSFGLCLEPSFLLTHPVKLVPDVSLTTSLLVPEPFV